MRCLLGLAACLATMGYIEARAQEPNLAREGRGLLPSPAEIPATLGGTPPPHPFVKIRRSTMGQGRQSSHRGASGYFRAHRTAR
jgi:hypothetical protein